MDGAFSESLFQLAAKVVARAREFGCAVSFAHAAYVLLTLPPSQATASGSASKATSACAAAPQESIEASTCDVPPFRFSLSSPVPSQQEAETAVSDAVLTLQQRTVDPAAAALALQVTFEAALLDSAADAALLQTRLTKKVEEAAALVVHADHSQLRRPKFVCLLRERLIAYCLAALPMVDSAADPEEAAATAARSAPAESAASAAAVAAAKATVIRDLFEDAFDGVLPITRIPCLYSLTKIERRKHLSELRCIVLASLLLQQRRAAATRNTATEERFSWLVPPMLLATSLAAEQQELLLNQAVQGQDALQRIKHIFSVDGELSRILAGQSVFEVQQIRFVQALLVQQQQHHAAAAAAAEKCEEELAGVERYLQQHKGQAHPDEVYGNLAAAGEAYLAVYKENQMLLHLAQLRLLQLQHAEALRLPDTAQLSCAALRMRRRVEHEQQKRLLLRPASSSSSNDGDMRSAIRGFRVLAAGETNLQKPAELGGYCLQTLLENKALVQGDTQAGGIEVGEEIFLFSSRRCLREFLQKQQLLQEQQPQLKPAALLQQQLSGAVRHTPALIFALGLEKRFPELDLRAFLVWAYHQELRQLQAQALQLQEAQGEQQADWDFRPELWVRLSAGKSADAPTSTDDLLQLTAEPFSSKCCDEWELRRQALQQARLCDCECRSTQTLLSSFQREAETQATERRETATSTDVAAGTSCPRSTLRLRGLRGVDAQANNPLKTLVFRLNF
ncbi:uncharacterized protein LOC34618127 [Cyclospora cayetanensis]|uniref:Cilia- and flagella-associated protein 206 n=1 Tax=Cyclospora cayetanensis TaxID=88456 RepID=A0A6P6S439_9EIME|nr:uncharacterized protein LOC34618127 [Cyclospora cayetanensis]